MKQAIKTCPECGSKNMDYDGMKRFHCQTCGWMFYMNTAAAVAGIFERDGKFLAVKRNLNPGKGLYDLPGGFLDPHETAEEALRREIREELSVEVGDLNYLCTAPNEYAYKGIEYTTCDIFYVAPIGHDEFSIDADELSGIAWFTKEDVNLEDFAFSSIREAIKVYIHKD